MPSPWRRQPSDSPHVRLSAECPGGGDAEAGAGMSDTRAWMAWGTGQRSAGKRQPGQPAPMNVLYVYFGLSARAVKDVKTIKDRRTTSVVCSRSPTKPKARSAQPSKKIRMGFEGDTPKTMPDRTSKVPFIDTIELCRGHFTWIRVTVPINESSRISPV